MIERLITIMFLVILMVVVGLLGMFSHGEFYLMTPYEYASFALLFFIWDKV